MRPFPLLVAGIVLLACVLLSVHIFPGASSVPLIPRIPAWTVLAGWVLLALALVAAAGWAAADALKRRRRRAGQIEERPVSLWPLFLASASALILTVGLAGLALSFLKPPPQEPGQAAPPRVEREDEEETPEETEAAERPFDPRALVIILLSVTGAGAVVLIVGLAVRLARDRRSLPERSEEVLTGLRRDLAVGLRLGIAEILADADCRRAVIACYARMEKSLAAAGWAREQPETPLEYLDRVLRDAKLVPSAGASSPTERALAGLTRLYEIARFSEHAVAPGDRALAVDALRLLEAAVAGHPGAGGEEGAR